MQTPERHPRAHRSDAVRKRQHEVGDDQQGETGGHDPEPADGIGQRSGRPGCRRIHGVHHHHHGGHQCHVQADRLRAQQQKRLGESRQREQRRNRHDDPIGRAEAPELGAAQRIAHGLGARRARGLAHAENDDRDRQERRHHRDPEHQGELVGREQHEHHRHQGAQKCAHGVERLPQSDARAAQLRWSEVGDECIARRIADALAKPVDEARRRQPVDVGGERKDRLCQRRKTVAQRGQKLAP